ncbi:MAG: DUF4011 domain-containing protein [Planctomycetota bacterium]
MVVQIPERAASRYAGRYSSSSDVAQLFETLRDSIRIALESSDEETARARYDLAIECYHQLESLDLPAEIQTRLREFVEELVERFPTAWRVNAAIRAVERADAAESDAVRDERLADAREILASGRGEDDVDQTAIDARLVTVDERMAGAPTAETSLAPIEPPSAIAELDEPIDLAPTEPDLEIQLGVLGRVHLAMLRGTGRPLHSISVRSLAATPLGASTLALEADPAAFAAAEVELPPLEPGATLTLDAQRVESLLQFDASLLAQLTEPTVGHVHARVLRPDGTEVARASAEWTLLPADTWPGSSVRPEVLAAFVLPDDPFVAQLVSSAAEKLGPDGPLDGYASKDPVWALAVVRAVYAALREEGFESVPSPVGFEDDGQSVRFPAAIALSRVATGLDAALLAAAVLEAASLHAVVVLADGRALVGVWLIDRTFSNPLVEEPVRLAKRIELAEVVAFDPSAASKAPEPALDFEGARQRADEALADRDRFHFAVDVTRARLGGMLPLPTFADGSQGGESTPTVPTRDLEADLAAYLAAERVREAAEETPATRLDRWLRQLLDLTMRNRLLNSTSKSKRVVPLLGSHLEEVEDRLARGSSFRVVERPSELAGKGEPDEDSLRAIDPLLRAGIEAGELRTHLGDAEIQERLTNLYRDARTAREEGGANSLFLALGFLHFRETPRSTKVRRAPLLLVPLEMKRLSGRRGYSIAQGDDDPRVNVTLLEYLRRDHDIEVPGLEPLPMDDDGVDVALVFRIVQEAIKDEDDWEVAQEAQIGLYSFSKFLLWRDLRDRSDVLRQNALVAHLLDRPNEPFESDVESPDPATLDRTVRPSDVFAPLSYDSTQLSAILAATRGRTMVLEGPPGTGKSQTITNLIAHAIACEERVLFVSEKMAALDVVYRRLRGLGLGPACLELHSNKASKKGVLAQFQEALEDGRVRGARRRDWEAIAADVEATRERLNRHVDALHEPRQTGESIHEVVSKLGREGRRGANDLELGIGDPRAVEEGTLDGWRALLDEIDVVASDQLVGPENALLLVGRTEYSPLVEDETRSALRAYDAPASEFLVAARALCERIGVEAGAPADASAWDALGELAKSLATVPGEIAALERVLGNREVAEAAADALEASEELATIDAGFRATFRESPTTLDVPSLEAARRDLEAGGLFGFIKRWLAGRKLRAGIRTIAVEPGRVDAADGVRTLDALRRAKELEGRIASVGENERAIVGPFGPRGAENLEAARDRVDRARAVAVAVDDLAARTNRQREAIRGPVAAAVSGPLLPADVAPLVDAFDAARAEHDARHADVLAAAEPLPDAPLGAGLDDVAALQALVLRWIDRWSDLRGWSRWASLRVRAIDAGLGTIVEALESGSLAAGSVRAAFDGAFARAWSLHEISADERLKAFDGVDQVRAIERFVELDVERLDAAREEVRQRVGAERPTPQTLRETQRGTSLGTLQREIAKKTRHMAIRRLLSELGDLAMELKPCFLMSPMSVAQYLDADHPRFDLVVFDEASQIPVWDAIGAIARGKQAVVVGDPKQLPPTSFFDRGDDDAIEEDEIEDLESILEECIGAQVPTQRLSWHYRSRHESLIAFSNERYYDGRLITFPSNASEDLGVSMCFVSDGVYDKGRTRTNAPEARAVVDEVVRRLKDAEQRERSIGVVTFSQAQQELVLDLFDEAIRDAPEIEEFFDENREEPVFVKNLENVQGDERDVIVFSIGYGPDQKGRISMNFGPLNRDGGERRLNVAITRAREQVLVFSSIRSEQIDLGRTSARAVRDLKAFLRYAERGSLPSTEETGGSIDRPRDELVQSVASALRERGWDVDTDVGASRLRVDVAVREPERSDRFLVGIETDGFNYAHAATARDRDRLQSLVLEGLGWDLVRVWAIDWWRDPDAEIERLDARIRAALEAARQDG